MAVLILEENYDVGDTSNLTEEQIDYLVSRCLNHFRSIDPDHCGTTRAYMEYDSGLVVCVSERSSTDSIYKMSMRIMEKYGKGPVTPDKDGNITFWVNDFNHSIKS